MPCNFGYKNAARVRIPTPQPQKFKAEIYAPEIDGDLLVKLGEEDAEFLEWLQELDTKPLLEEALKRALAKISSNGLRFKINSKGMLEAEGSFTTAVEKRRLSETTSKISERWQFEILGIVTQLLGYSFTISQNGDELILEAEEEGKVHPCDYIKITKTKDGEGTLTFEHFKTRKLLQIGMAKFLALARKLGIKIEVGESETSEGDKIATETGHTHRHKHGR